MRGEINRQQNSLFAAMAAGGADTQVAVELAGVFSGEIDFNTELQPGDDFGVLYERFVRDDAHVTYGDVLAAEFNNAGRQVYGFRFAVPGEPPVYFDDEGPLAETAVPAGAVQAGAPGDVALLAQPHAPDTGHAPRASGRGLRRADRDARHRGRQRDRRVGGRERGLGEHGAATPHQRL